MGANTGEQSARHRPFCSPSVYISPSIFRASWKTIPGPTLARLPATGELDLEFSQINLPEPAIVAYHAFEPVFDDFGDLVGALGAVRTLESASIRWKISPPFQMPE